MSELDDLVLEYNQLKQDKINWLERSGDFFKGTDERLDYAVPKILEIIAKINALVIPDCNGGPAMSEIGRIQMIPYSQTEQPETAVRMSEIMPFKSYVTLITIHWPDGCDGLVDVMAGHGNFQFVPWSGFLSFNDAWPQFGFMETVEQEEYLWVDIGNADDTNEHTISIMITIQEVLV